MDQTVVIGPTPRVQRLLSSASSTKSVRAELDTFQPTMRRAIINPEL